ncbi:hypothetical protein C4556_02070 [Candidatus Parcubacteria bacterium]|nr:MAG: hypothetical protein C4556_02070 [Candidatus Parcubacteria bacterium]
MAEIIKFGDGRNNSKGKLERKVDLTQKITETVGFLMNLRVSDPRSYDPENIAERRKAIQAWSNDDLREAIMTGNELKWKEKPSWYHAVLSELNSRVNKRPEK